jgi:hypothetical protein
MLLRVSVANRSYFQEDTVEAVCSVLYKLQI